MSDHYIAADHHGNINHVYVIVYYTCEVDQFFNWTEHNLGSGEV